MKSFACISALVLMAGCATTSPADAPDTHHYTPEELNALPQSKFAAAQSYGQASPRQVGELRLPKGRGPFPVAMLVHGGCWDGRGSPAQMVPIADWLAARGVASWNVDYRELGSGGGWPMTFQDWAGALAALKPLALRYPLDLTRVSVIGHSAGATPAAWLGSGSQGDEILVEGLPKVRGSVILDGPIGLAPYAGGIDKAICERSVVEPLMGGSPAKVPARYAILDPLKNPPTVRDMLVVDGALPAQRAEDLAAVRAAGVHLEVIEVSQDQHFDLLKPGTPDFEKIAPALLRVTRGR
jgi:acetyl esterase/lipase